jgi:hypothetical protein
MVNYVGPGQNCLTLRLSRDPVHIEVNFHQKFLFQRSQNHYFLYLWIVHSVYFLIQITALNLFDSTFSSHSSKFNTKKNGFFIVSVATFLSFFSFSRQFEEAFESVFTKKSSVERTKSPDWNGKPQNTEVTYLLAPALECSKNQDSGSC